VVRVGDIESEKLRKLLRVVMSDTRDRLMIFGPLTGGLYVSNLGRPPPPELAKFVRFDISPGFGSERGKYWAHHFSAIGSNISLRAFYSVEYE